MMIIPYIVLLLLAFFCAGSDAAEALFRSEPAANLEITGVTNLSSITSARLLRAESGNDPTLDGEERGPNGEWMSKLAEADQKVWKLRKVDMKLSEKAWISMGKSPVDMFNTFDGLHNTWAKIETNKKTVQWFRFTKAYRAKWGTRRFTDRQIYLLLATKVAEGKLVFESLKQIPGLKNLAETMQNYQFRLWISRKESPRSVAPMLGIPHGAPLTGERGPEDEILSAFRTMLNNS